MSTSQIQIGENNYYLKNNNINFIQRDFLHNYSFNIFCFHYIICDNCPICLNDLDNFISSSEHFIRSAISKPFIMYLSKYSNFIVMNFSNNNEVFTNSKKIYENYKHSSNEIEKGDQVIWFEFESQD